jgi:hypothetical protein
MQLFAVFIFPRNAFCLFLVSVDVDVDVDVLWGCDQMIFLEATKSHRSPFICKQFFAKKRLLVLS